MDWELTVLGLVELFIVLWHTCKNAFFGCWWYLHCTICSKNIR